MTQRSLPIATPVRTHLQWLVYGTLIALPLTSQAQEPLPAPRSLAPAEKAVVTTPRVSLITLGTTKERVDSFLGVPRSGWIIPCLCRSVYIYPDGTKVFFVEGRVISVVPNGLADGSPGNGYVVERDGRQIFIEPIALRGVLMDGPAGAVKREVEERFFFAPPFRDNIPLPPLPWIGQVHPHFQSR